MSTAIQQATQKTQVAQAQNNGKSLKSYIASMQGEIAKALPSVMTPERFTRITLSALSGNPTLQSCTPTSFLAAMMTAAQLGVEPNTPLGQAYLLPYKNRKKVKDAAGKDQWTEVMECQFQLGYKGLLDLAYRSGDISVIQAHTVYEKDQFEYQYGLDAKLTHRPCMDANKGKPIAFYAMFRTKDGGYGFEVMSYQDIEAHAQKYSKAYSSGYSPWSTNFEEMAKKTVLKKVLKYAPLKSDFVRQIATDETIKEDIAKDMTEVNSEPIIISDAEVVDSETGEIIKPAEQQGQPAPAQEPEPDPAGNAKKK